jgi:hypothetical protein
MWTKRLRLCIVLAVTGLLGADDGKDQLRATARIEVEAKPDCFSVRFFIKNETNEGFDLAYGAGNGGQTVVPTFAIGQIHVTPPIYRFPLKRSLRPNILHFPEHTEVLYGTYTMGYPPENVLDRERQTIQAFIQFQDQGQREPELRLTTPAIPFPPRQPHGSLKQK